MIFKTFFRILQKKLSHYAPYFRQSFATGTMNNLTWPALTAKKNASSLDTRMTSITNGMITDVATNAPTFANEIRKPRWKR